MAIIKTISDLLWGMPLIVLILLAGIIFTVGSKFFQIAHLKHLLMLGGFLFDAYIAITNFREVSRILRTSIKRE